MRNRSVYDRPSDIFVPKDAVSAVVAQFDKLPSSMKTILRVASVSGIYLESEFYIITLKKYTYRPVF